MYTFKAVKITLISLIIILLPSCLGAKPTEINGVKLREVQSEIIQPNLFLGNPYRMLLIKDNLLIADRFDGYTISKVDLSGKQPSQRLLRQGRGPHELLSLRHFFVDSKNQLILFDGTADEVVYYRLLDGNVEVTPKTWEHTVQIDDRKAREKVPLGEMILCNGAYENAEFCLYNLKGESLLRFGTYPGKVKSSLSPSGRFLQTQTLLAPRPDGERFAVAGSYHDQLSFYAMRDNKPVLLKEYFTNDSKMSVVESGYGEKKVSSTRVSDETVNYYAAVYPTQDFLYVLYLGFPFKQKLEGVRSSGIIYAYTWDGELQCGYKLPTSPLCFAVDERDRTLYAVINSSEDIPQLIRFSLD